VVNWPTADVVVDYKQKIQYNRFILIYIWHTCISNWPFDLYAND